MAKKDPMQVNKGHIFMSWNTFIALWASSKTLVLFKKVTKIQHRKVLYPISRASKPDVYGQLEARILNISLSYKFSFLFHYGTSLTVIKSHWLRYQLAQLKYFYLYLVLNKNSIYGITWGKQNSIHFLTLLQLTRATEAALCHLLLV